MAIITTKNGQVEKVEFKGCVVKTMVQEERVMSDVYANVQRAMVFDAKNNTFSVVYVRAYFELDSGDRTAEVDATPEIMSLYDAFERCREAQDALHAARARMERELAALHAPAKGRKVRVFKGRKVPVGTEGECFYVGEGQYGRRVGLKDAAGNVHWTSADNVEAVLES